jgi:hypothetical protein
MKRTTVLCLVLGLTPALAAAASPEPEPPEFGRLTSASAVSITDRGDYYQVILDYTQGATPRQMGEEYSRAILRMVPDFGHLLDSYLVEMVPEEFYHSGTQQILLFRPTDMHVEVFFRPKTGGLPREPKFNRIDILF